MTNGLGKVRGKEQMYLKSKYLFRDVFQYEIRQVAHCAIGI